MAEVCGQALRAWQAPPRSWGVLEAAQSWCCGFGLTLVSLCLFSSAEGAEGNTQKAIFRKMN